MVLNSLQLANKFERTYTYIVREFFVAAFANKTRKLQQVHIRNKAMNVGIKIIIVKIVDVHNLLLLLQYQMGL